MPSPYDTAPLSPSQQAVMADLIASVPREQEPPDLYGMLPPPVQPSPYVATLAMAFLLAPEMALDVLRALYLQHARAEGIDGDAVLEATSARLRAEGILP